MNKATNGLPAEHLLHIHQEIEIAAPVSATFEALLEQLGPGFEVMTGNPMPMTLEPWPGGRWFRDLGNNTGHFWGHVQVIKPPTLLEITGPLFMSYAAVSHLQYRLKPHNGGTLLALTHRALGEIDPQHRTGVNEGWNYQLTRVKSRAEQ